MTIVYLCLSTNKYYLKIPTNNKAIKNGHYYIHLNISIITYHPHRYQPPYLLYGSSAETAGGGCRRISTSRSP